MTKIYKSLKSGQKGSTIIVVMIILLMLTIVGVFSIRTAMTTLNIATNAQVEQFLSQTADTPINKILIDGPGEQTSLANAVGQAIADSKVEPGKEYVFCYKPKSNVKFASAASMAVLRVGSGGAASLADGSGLAFCDLSSDFGSAREAVVTQVAVKIPTDTSEFEDLALIARGNNASLGQVLPTGVTEQQRIRITTTSVVPAFAKDRTAAQNCMKNYINDDTDQVTRGMQTVAQCLANLGVPVTSQMQELNLQTMSTMQKEPT
ncbi:pilus assembly PilX family protein [Acinetobacter populi]|uniref:Pilus assembly protein PilX n=1 Tax=Acinetobacter populi TaxID=1582270 RepID=A0A1Z9YWF7_9GAMM|nr:pilus assembly PilX N-terminal domain-containing protein [Acinetobacter populi]OUY06550.1 hypothetical protein CAP51_11505 [Acinetobacter populi]